MDKEKSVYLTQISIFLDADHFDAAYEYAKEVGERLRSLDFVEDVFITRIEEGVIERGDRV